MIAYAASCLLGVALVLASCVVLRVLLDGVARFHARGLARVRGEER